MSALRRGTAFCSSSFLEVSAPFLETHCTATCSLPWLPATGLSVMGRELNVQEHGAMLLAEMACNPGVSAQDVLESIVTVANIARLQLQDK